MHCRRDRHCDRGLVVQIDFFKIGLKRFRRQAARKAIRKYNYGPFFLLSANTKGEVRYQFAKLGMNPGKLFESDRTTIKEIVESIGVYSCIK